MLNFICSLAKKRFLLLLLALVLFCGCGSPSSASQASPIPTSGAQAPASPTPTSTAHTQASPTPTSRTQITFTSYVGKWEVHGSLLSINADYTGLEQWNVGPCSQSTTQVQMCNGNAHIVFTENTDGSIKGTIQSVNYSQWTGGPAPTGFQPDATDPRARDTFQLQHSGAHLLYTTWFGERLHSLNDSNRYWCDAYAVKAGWKQCGA